MKSYLKFAVAIVCFFCMTLFSADAYGQSSSAQKTVKLKQLYEQVHGAFSDRGQARLAFYATSTNVQKWNEVVNSAQANSASAEDQTLLNNFYDSLVERTNNASTNGDNPNPNGGLIKN